MVGFVTEVDMCPFILCSQYDTIQKRSFILFSEWCQNPQESPGQKPGDFYYI